MKQVREWSMWLPGAKSTPGRGKSQSKVIEMGSCVAYLRSGIDTCVAGTEGLIKESCGAMRWGQRGRMMVGGTGGTAYPGSCWFF